MNEALLKAIVSELRRQDGRGVYVALDDVDCPLPKDVFVNGRIDLVALVNVIDKVIAGDQVECPSCRAHRDHCRLCNGSGVVTEQQARDWPEA